MKRPEPEQLLTPAMRSVASAIARAGRPPFYSLTPDQARASYELGAGVLELPVRALALVQDFTLTARDGAALQTRLYVPRAAVVGERPWPTLLYFHGGGFTIGSIATHDVLCRELSHAADCAVVSVDYRLAPEHKFPTAADDAWDALQGLVKIADSLGLDASRLAVGGDSAGGTLAAVCAVLARDAGLPLVLQLLIYPGCAAHQDTRSHRTFGHGFILDEPSITWFFNQYIRTPADRDDWRFAPLNAADVDGVAPAWLGLAECDPLLDEGLLYADKLRAAGVAVDLEIYRGVTHEFIKMGRAIPEALQAQADAALALRQAFHVDVCIDLAHAKL
ncbi:MAG: alpha/beta hydrolase [Polaromonas sp.]|nr:alpha/beta hydrolase [Polaromonas sp.]